MVFGVKLIFIQMFSSLEPELQDKLRKNEQKSTELVPLNYKPPQFVSDQAKMTAVFKTISVIIFPPIIV